MAKNKPLKTSAPEAKEYSSRLDFKEFYKTHLPNLKENSKTEAKALCPFHAPELYKGYYWLITHLDPYNFSFGFINEVGVKNIHPVPDCIQCARNLFMEMVEPNDITNKGLTPDHPQYSHPFPYVDPDKIFAWLLEQGIPKLHVEGREIKEREDVKIWWKHINMPDPAEKFWEREYENKYLHWLEHYLEPEHTKNLKELETPASQAGQGQDLTLYLNPTAGQFTFKKKKSKPPLPQGYTTTFASMLIQAWKGGQPLTQKKMLEQAGRWKDHQNKPLKKDSQWLYDRVHPIRKALQFVKVNMPQATREGYKPPARQKAPTKFLIL